MVSTSAYGVPRLSSEIVNRSLESSNQTVSSSSIDDLTSAVRALETRFDGVEETLQLLLETFIPDDKI